MPSGQLSYNVGTACDVNQVIMRDLIVQSNIMVEL